MDAARFFSPRLWLALPAAAFLFLAPTVGSAQDYPAQAYPRAQNPDAPSASSWQNLRQLSIQLESLALRARDEAKIDARHRGSGELAEKIDDFAKHAHELRLYMNERGVSSSKVNDMVRKLVDDASKVRKESVKAKRHNPETDAAWNRTVTVLDRLNREYLAANGIAAPIGTTGAYASRRPYAGSWAETRLTILNDLDRRAEDAARLSESANLDIAPQIDRLRDQVRSFREGSDELSLADTRDNISRLLADARAAQANLAGSDAPARLRDDVNAMVGLLVQMRDMTSESVGTSGYGPEPGIDTDRYATMDAVELGRELELRMARASDLASQYEMGAVFDDISHLRDRARNFRSDSATMSFEDRREAADHLLQDAQRLQRQLARRRASSDLVNQWNAVVDLLARLRDAA